MREFMLERSQEIGNKFLAWTLETKPCPISINDTYWFKKLCGLFEAQATLEQRIEELEVQLKSKDIIINNQQGRLNYYATKDLLGEKKWRLIL